MLLCQIHLAPYKYGTANKLAEFCGLILMAMTIFHAPTAAWQSIGMNPEPGSRLLSETNTFSLLAGLGLVVPAVVVAVILLPVLVPLLLTQASGSIDPEIDS